MNATLITGASSGIGEAFAMLLAQKGHNLILIARRQVLTSMKKRNGGKILNVASTAAFQPVPNLAVYAATKAFVLHFTEALHFELKHTNISVSALCPGATITGFQQAAKMESSSLFKNGMNAGEVALIGYKGLQKNKMTIIPGFKNKLLALLANMTPFRKLSVWVAAQMT